MSALTFAEQLVAELETLKSQVAEEDIVINAKEDDSKEPLSPLIIKHWLNFAVYYEKAAVHFISHWLQSTTHDDALVHFAHQIEDEANHYRWLKKILKKYV